MSDFRITKLKALLVFLVTLVFITPTLSLIFTNPSPSPSLDTAEPLTSTPTVQPQQSIITAEPTAPEDRLDQEITADQHLEPLIGSRAARKDEEEPNDNPANATGITSSQTSMVGDLTSSSDVDWFKIKTTIRKDSNDNTVVKNITIKLAPPSIDPNPLTGDTDHVVGVSVYGWFDINQNEDLDPESELYFLKLEIFQIGVAIGPTLFVNTYNDNYYYIKIECDGGFANYPFRIKSNDTIAPEKNQDITYADRFVTQSPYRLDLDTDAFDWYYVNKNPLKNDVGLNFSINVKMETYASQSSVVLEDGMIINFVTVLHMLVYHENRVVDGTPFFPWQFRDHIKLSRHVSTKYSYEVEYSDIITLPTSLFHWTYVGFFVESYGLSSKHPGVKFYPLVSDMVDYSKESFCTYTIEDSDLDSIKRPVLSKVSVRSTTTNDIHGKTYDDYQYSVIYMQENNYKPYNTKISVFTTDGEVQRSMKEYPDPTIPSSLKYKAGVEYRITFSGLLLGEGDFHVFQFHFKDRNTYGIGTIELGKSWHGPYISNNIKPYVRPTAPTSLTLNEDDETTYFDLNSVFEDVDIKEELNFTMTDPKVEPSERVWGKSYSDSVCVVNIVNQTRLKIELKPDANGEVKILLNVTDKKHYYIDPIFEFTINVLPINDPPQIIQYFSVLIIDEDEVYTDIFLGEYFVDLVDNEPLTYSAENYHNMIITIAEDSNVKITPELNWHGSVFIDFFASDGIEEVTDFLKVIIKAKNDVPLLPINGTIEMWEDAWSNLTIPASDTADNESIIINHNLTHIFPDLKRKPKKYGYTFDNITGYMSLKPLNNMVGEYSWNISALDVNNELNFTHVKLIIHNVNDPPRPTILYPEPGGRFLTTDKITFRGEAHDPDSELKDVDFRWFTIIEGVEEKLDTGAVLQPQLLKNGTHTIKLSVRDEELTTNVTVKIYVFSINQDLDTDGDDIPDYWENLFNFNLNDPHDAKEDPDRDTFSNWEEYEADTDPRDTKDMPERHIYKESETTKKEDTISPMYLIIIIIVLLVIIFIVVRIRTRRRKAKEAEGREYEPGSTEGIIGMASPMKGGKGYGKYKPPTVICHRCGKSLKVMTLNRPVAVTCTDCGARGAVY